MSNSMSHHWLQHMNYAGWCIGNSPQWPWKNLMIVHVTEWNSFFGCEMQKYISLLSPPDLCSLVSILSHSLCLFISLHAVLHAHTHTAVTDLQIHPSTFHCKQSCIHDCKQVFGCLSLSSVFFITRQTDLNLKDRQCGCCWLSRKFLYTVGVACHGLNNM